MCLRKITILVFILVVFVINTIPVYSYVSELEGLDIEISKINNFPLSKQIIKHYDLYELYIINRSNNTYSIPGYSFNFDVDHYDLQELTVQAKGTISKKFAILNIATTALFIPFGGFARSAGRSAVSSVSSFKKKGLNIYDTENLLMEDRIYMLYPNQSRVLYFLISKDSTLPRSVKFVCKNEGLNINHVVINNDITVENVVLEVSGKFKKHYETDSFPVMSRFLDGDIDEWQDEYYGDPVIDEYQ